MTYARFTARFIAMLIDGAVLTLVIAAASLVLGIDPRHGGLRPDSMRIEGMDALNVVAGWLYFALQESSAAGATLGKRALGIRVVGLGGGRISFARATGRHFAKWLSALPLGLGFLMASFTAKKQALHDILAGTLVVSKDSTRGAADGTFARWER